MSSKSFSIYCVLR